MRQFHRVLITASIVSTFTLNVFATQGGSSTAQFLKIGQSARAEAMGGAFTAVANDAFAPQFNPAGIAQITTKEIGLSHLEFIEEVSSQYGAFILPFNPVAGSLGISFNYIDQGSIVVRDSAGAAAGGDSEVTAYAAQVTWGQAVGDRLALGATGKLINQDLAGTSESGFAFDGGILLSVLPNKLTLGASFLNLGPKHKLGTTDENIPLIFRGGASYFIIPDLIVSVDVEKERDTDVVLHGGTEYIYRNQFAVRGGYRDTLEADGGFSAGAGFIWKPGTLTNNSFFDKKDNISAENSYEIRFDYGFVDYGDFDDTHRVSVTFAF